jgi:hypothetical protein
MPWLQNGIIESQNPNLGTNWKALERKIRLYSTAIWYILWTFGIFYGHLVYFTSIWYILLPFGIFYFHFGIFYGHLVVFWYKQLPVLVCYSCLHMSYGPHLTLPYGTHT